MKKKTPTKKRKGAKKSVPKVKLDPIKEAQALLGKDGVADVLRMTDDDVLFHVRRFISTQSLALDRALGFTGIPCGRITEIAGDNHTGKSTLLDHILAEAQKCGGYAVLVDTEQGHNIEYSRAIGIDPEKLMVLQPRKKTLEGVFQSLSKVLDLFDTKFPEMTDIVIGVDSVAGLPTDADLAYANDEGKQKPGDAAKTLHNMCRVLGSKIARREIALIFTNQLYTAFGGGYSYKKSYGGDAIPYHASLRLKTRKKENIKSSNGQVLGQVCSVEIIKSKIWNVPRGATADIGLIHGVGVDNVWTIVEEFKKRGLINVGGSWSTMHIAGESEPRKWQRGHVGLSLLCKEDPELMGKLVAAYAVIGVENAPV